MTQGYNDIKVALVCISKNEDEYIQEWIDYHVKLGFDKIFIYQNNWRCEFINNEKVVKLILDGENKQRKAYNDFIRSYKKEYDWAAFFDVDEFLVLKKHENIHHFIKDYNEFNSISINWVLFGDNGISKINEEKSVLKRFTKRQIKINEHVKSIVKLSNNFRMNVHSPTIRSCSPEREIILGPFNPKGSDKIAQLNHYFCKTKEEFLKKINRGRADTSQIRYRRTMNDFDKHNFNDIEDLTAYNFMYNDNNNLLNTQRF
jgi:hypothetical protein